LGVNTFKPYLEPRQVVAPSIYLQRIHALTFLVACFSHFAFNSLSIFVLSARDDNRVGRGRVSLSHTHPYRKKPSPSPHPNPMGIKFLSHPHPYQVTGIISYPYPYPFSYTSILILINFYKTIKNYIKET